MPVLESVIPFALIWRKSELRQLTPVCALWTVTPETRILSLSCSTIPYLLSVRVLLAMTPLKMLPGHSKHPGGDVNESTRLSACALVSDGMQPLRMTKETGHRDGAPGAVVRSTRTVPGPSATIAPPITYGR